MFQKVGMCSAKVRAIYKVAISVLGTKIAALFSFVLVQFDELFHF